MVGFSAGRACVGTTPPEEHTQIMKALYAGESSFIDVPSCVDPYLCQNSDFVSMSELLGHGSNKFQALVKPPTLLDRLWLSL